MDLAVAVGRQQHEVRPPRCAAFDSPVQMLESPSCGCGELLGAHRTAALLLPPELPHLPSPLQVLCQLLPRTGFTVSFPGRVGRIGRRPDFDGPPHRGRWGFGQPDGLFLPVRLGARRPRFPTPRRAGREILRREPAAALCRVVALRPAHHLTTNLVVPALQRLLSPPAPRIVRPACEERIEPPYQFLDSGVPVACPPG